MVAVEQSCPVVEFPTHAPSRGFIATLTKGLAGGICKDSVIDSINGAPGVESEEMVCVTVLVAIRVDILIPFLKLAVLTHLIGINIVETFLPFNY